MAAHTVYVNGVNSVPTQFTGLQAAITYMAANFPNLTSNNGSGAAGPLNIEISITSSEGQVIVNGFTTSATSYVNIYTVAPARHAGVWDATKYRIEAANVDGALAIRDDHVRIDGLQVNLTGSNANFQGAISYNDGFITGTNEFHLSNCIAIATGSGFRVQAIRFGDSSITGQKVWNCIAIALGGEVHFASVGMGFNHTGTASVYNCTLVGTGSGVTAFAAVTVTLKNCYAHTLNTSVGFGFYANSGTFTQTTCAASDTSATDAALDNIPYSTATFINVTAGSEDFRLPPGSGLLEVGTDTSGESAPLNFTTDIAGTTRSGPWEVGAFTVAAVAAPEGPLYGISGVIRRPPVLLYQSRTPVIRDVVVVVTPPPPPVDVPAVTRRVLRPDPAPLVRAPGLPRPPVPVAVPLLMRAPVGQAPATVTPPGTITVVTPPIPPAAVPALQRPQLPPLAGAIVTPLPAPVVVAVPSLIPPMAVPPVQRPPVQLVDGQLGGTVTPPIEAVATPPAPIIQTIQVDGTTVPYVPIPTGKE